VVTNAISDPRAMVVHFGDTDSAILTMMSSFWLPCSAMATGFFHLFSWYLNLIYGLKAEI